MPVLDASALIALLRAEPGADTVRDMLQDRTQPSAISAVNLTESVDVLVRVFGISETDVTDAFDLLEMGGLAVIAVDGRTAWRAGLFRAAHYRKRTAEISQADCIAAVTAQQRAEGLVTSDRVLATVARSAGIDVVAFRPGSSRFA